MTASSKSSAHKWSFWAVILAALIAAIVTLLVNRDKLFSNHKKYISGIVTDAGSRAPMDHIVVQVETDDGKIKQDTTDGEGRFSIEISTDDPTVRLLTSPKGYYSFNKKLPAETTKNDIALQRLLMTIGVAPDTTLDQALTKISGTLNVTIVFSNCSVKAKTSKLSGGELEMDFQAPERTLKTLVTQVRDTRSQYRVSAIEIGKRYEISCY